MTGTAANEVVVSKLVLVDLAGSERTALTGATGVLLHQSIGINKSLFVLRKVIAALAKQNASEVAQEAAATAAAAAPGGLRFDKRGRLISALAGGGPAAVDALTHVPYRDSTLTRLLKPSLGGNSLTLMIACVAPSDHYYEENLSTLNYASLAKRISNTATVNEDPKTRLIRQLRKQIKFLKEQLARSQQVLVVNDGAGGAGAAAAPFRIQPGVGYMRHPAPPLLLFFCYYFFL